MRDDADGERRLDVTLVVAAARNGIIGRDGDMPWRMPSSLKRFRSLTMGRPMVMGRKTYEAIGRPLDGRDTIIVTRNAGLRVAGAHVAGTIEAGLALGVSLANSRGVDEIIIAGGGEIYRAALPYATRVELDQLDTDVEGDTRMPELAPEEWQEVQHAAIPSSPGDQHAARAILFLRIGPPRALPMT